MAIKNIIFDVGNVIVKWSPTDIIARTFNLSGDECQAMANTIFQHQIWLDINKGKISELEAKLAYQEQLQLTPRHFRYDERIERERVRTVWFNGQCERDSVAPQNHLRFLAAI
ncbi:hypothetical protein TUMSATVNIG2_18880 [Vibrio nigripulchritudo]|nr:hypothetical protein TUMSATVNIG2_18880 [Vibrio nigripulchritudo]